MPVRQFWGIKQGLLEVEWTVAPCTAICQQLITWCLAFANAATQTWSPLSLKMGKT